VAALTYAQVVAGIRATIAAYARALDDAEPDELAATFCRDGVLVLYGADVITGRSAILAKFSEPTKPGVSRHVVVNTHVTAWSDIEAEGISDVAVIGRNGDSGWTVRSVGRYVDTFHRANGVWLFHSRTLE
jgi:hypothetical protein